MVFEFIIRNGARMCSEIGTIDGQFKTGATLTVREQDTLTRGNRQCVSSIEPAMRKVLFTVITPLVFHRLADGFRHHFITLF
jgi:hypothetical protein